MTGRDAMDPAIQAIFTAIESYMAANSLPQCSCNATASGAGMNESISCTQLNGDSYTFTYFTKGTSIVITPAGVSLGPGGVQQFTATATAADGSPIAAAAFAWTLTSGPGTCDATGLYTAPVTIDAAQNATIRCTLTGGAAWSQVILTVHP
jgi:hypothetical protein